MFRFRHQLATQKHVFTEITAASAPSPPAKERVPASFESRERSSSSRITSPFYSLGSSPSTIVANGFGSAGSTGSDPNLSRMFPTNGSMRQQLLRRLWHKEYRRLDRTGSLSPPLHRSLRTKRALKIQDTRPEVCLECERLEATHFNRSVPEITMKHSKHIASTIITKTTSSGSTLAFPRKSYSIETETLNDKNLMTISTLSDSSEPKSPQPTQSSNATEMVATHEMDFSIAATNMLNQMNGNFSNEDQLNGNVSSQADSKNEFLIEMEDDRINITTMAMAESTTISDAALQVSGNDSSFKQLEQLSESTISQSSSQWFHHSNDGNNNNNNSSENDSKSKITEIGHLRGGSYDAYHMSSGETDMENESVVRFKTHEPLDQSTIDTIISQILVDSLNNIIVVQGKGNQSDSNGNSNVELSSSQTQTENTVIDESITNASPLPLPVVDQIYFPHYLSTEETLSEYSTQLSNNSSAIEIQPANLVISVISGSAYPCDGGEMVVHRLSDMPRTESMEVQPSSAPQMHDDDENGNRINESIARTATTIEDDDDATSLVDSLDDPNAMANVSDLDNSPNELKIIEKSHAFFVSIENSDTCLENDDPSTADSSKFDLNAAVANTMPERLRERLERRQTEIAERREAEVKRRQDKIQKLINQHGMPRSSSDSKTNSSSFEVISDGSPKVTKKLPNNSKVAGKRGNSKQLHTEIGSLESYTVDAKGNLKFIEASKKSNGSKRITTISGPVVKHVAIKKTITTSKPLTVARKSRETVASDANTVGKRTKATSNGKANRAKEITSQTKVKNDVQKMTLSHNSPSNMITPDRDCGPRRMYQKTEIREGTKRIEILEIVECKRFFCSRIKFTLKDFVDKISLFIHFRLKQFARQFKSIAIDIVFTSN